MRTANVLTKTTKKPGFNHSNWYVVPHDNHPNSFDLKTKADYTICTFTFPKNGNAVILNLIACAPELQDIAEMYRDSMIGNPAEKSMLFEMVNEIINRITPHSV